MTRRAMRLLRFLTGTRNADGARAGGGMLLVMMALAGLIAAKSPKDDSRGYRSMNGDSTP